MREASGEKFWFSPLPVPIIATDSDDLTLKQREHKNLSMGDQSADWPRQSVLAIKRLFHSPLDEVQPLVANFSTPLGGLFVPHLVN